MCILGAGLTVAPDMQRISAGLIAATLMLLTPAASASEPKLHVGGLPPDRIGSSADFSEMRISDHYGKVVIVTFWATWCGPCLKELPVLESAQRQAGDEKLKVFAVNYKQGRDAFKTIVKKMKNAQMEFVFDAGRRVAKQFGVDGIPHMVIIGRDGRIANIHVGYGEGSTGPLIAELNELLRAPAPPPREDTTTPED